MKQRAMSVGVLVLACAGLACVSCQSGSGSETKSAAGAGAAMNLATTQRGFQVQLREVSMSGKRVFLFTGAMGEEVTGPGRAVQLSVALTDTQENRVYRVRPGAMLRSVKDQSGRELLGASGTALKNSNGGSRSEFTPNPESRSGMQTFTTSIPVERFPEGLSTVAGSIEVDLVSEDVERVIVLPAMDEPAEVCPGVRAVMKTNESDPTSGALTRMTVELRTEIPPLGARETGALVQSVEVLDANGSTMVTLVRREDSSIGDTLRRRFVYEGGMSQSRPDAKAVRAAKSLRVRVFSKVERLEIPFAFGPIELR